MKYILRFLLFSYFCYFYLAASFNLYFALFILRHRCFFITTIQIFTKILDILIPVFRRHAHSLYNSRLFLRWNDDAKFGYLFQGIIHYSLYRIGRIFSCDTFVHGGAEGIDIGPRSLYSMCLILFWWCISRF